MADKIFHTGFNQKTNPVGADKLMISDSQASNETKYADLDSLPISTAIQTALNGKQNTIGYNPLQSVVAGTNVTIDNTDPLNPVINSTGGGGSGDVTASGTLTNDTIILGGGTTTVKTSSKTIVTTLGTDDLTLPTSKAVKDVTDGKVTGNIAITGATKTKITYDSKGLVTSGADATTADIADSTDKRYVTDAQLTVIGNTSGTNTGNQTSIVGITGTKAEFDTAVSDGNICFDGDAVTNLTMSTNKLLGRSTAGTGVVEEITLGTGLSFSGTTLNASSGSNPIFEAQVAGEQVVGKIARFTVKGSQTIAGVKISLGTLPTGADFKVDVRRNGTASTNSIFTSDATIDITTGQSATNGIYTTTKTTIDNGTCAENDVLYVYITQIGSGISGTDLDVVIY